jgi:hypothetical protein
MAKGYTRESIERALCHHQLAQRIRFYSPPSCDNSKWRVHTSTLDVHEFTTPQAYAFCIGLASAAQAPN